MIVNDETHVYRFDTSMGGLTFSDQFLQLSSRLPSMNLYGIGEHARETHRHNMDYTAWGLMSRDEPTEPVSKNSRKAYIRVHSR